MDKRDHDAILNAYNVAKEQLARKKNDSDSAADALQESIVGGHQSASSREEPYWICAPRSPSGVQAAYKLGTAIRADG